MIAGADDMPTISQDINLMLCWFNERPLSLGGKYHMRINSNEAGCIVKAVNYKMNINTLEHESGNLAVNMNDIANVTIRTSKPVFYDPYKQNNITGSIILVDEGTNETVGAGMIIQ
jgi:sulfate adenylyltransferase subunit 1